GGDRYHVRLTIGVRGLDASCTCPVGATVCKHAVALALAFVAKQTKPAPLQATLPLPLPRATVTAETAGFAARGPLPEADGGDGGQQASAADTKSFATRVELEAWAEAHQVTHALWLSAEILYPQLPAQEAQRYGLRYVLGRLALR